MLTRFPRFRACCLISGYLLAPVAGCSKEEAPQSTTPAARVVQTAQSDAKVEAKVETKLAKADLVDGKADKIVTRCASCALNMDGSSEHTLKAHGYTLYFCTEACAEGSAENMTESILAMKIPED